MKQISNNENILYGGDVDFEVPNISYGEFILNAIDSGGEKTILIDGITDKQYTCKDLVEITLQNIEILKKLGLKYGDCISLCCENRLEFLPLVLSSMCFGTIISPCNPAYTTGELIHCLNISKPKVVICSNITVEQIIKATKDCKFIKKIISLDSISHKKLYSNCLNFEDLRRSVSQNLKLNDFPFPKFSNKDTIAIILYSSGTTGLPKGVMLTHHNLLFSHLINGMPEFNLVDITDDSIVSFLPLFHAYGCLSSILLLAKHIKTILLPRFELEKYLQLIEKHRATLSTVVPPICVLLAKSPLLDKYDLSSIKMIACGAASLSSNLSNKVSQRLDIMPIRQGYGMTETSLAVTRWPIEFLANHMNEKLASVGRLVPGTFAKVLDLTTGEPLPPYKQGELCFKGDLIMKGYYGNQKETNAIIDAHGWLHTGDVGYYDPDLYFYVVDRLKELIKVKGFQVAPAEIEATLLQNTSIIDVGVIGIPDERNGEVPVAFVVKQPGVSLTENDVKSFISERLSNPKHLRGGVIFVNEIPKNPSGKILRRKLKEMVSLYKSKL